MTPPPFLTILLNPRTGEEINIAASKIITFKPGKELKDSVNN